MNNIQYIKNCLRYFNQNLKRKTLKDKNETFCYLSCGSSSFGNRMWELRVEVGEFDIQ